MKHLFKQQFITKAALMVLVVSLLIITAASWVFVKAGKDVITSIAANEEAGMNALIEHKTDELKEELKRTILTNLDTVAMTISGFLYNYEMGAVKEVLDSYAHIKEIKAIRLIELPTGRELYSRENRSLACTACMHLEKEVHYQKQLIGKISVTYSDEAIETGAKEQKEEMLTRQKELQESILDAAGSNLAFYALFFGLFLLLALVLVLMVLIYLDREVSRKNSELKQINSSLEERIAKEVQKNRDNEQLLIEQSKMAAMGEMIGAIAHQWRQPLNALGLYIQDVKDAYIHNELNEEYVDELVRDAMRQIVFMSKTIDDFRNFYRPSKMEAEFSVTESIQDVLNLLYPQLKNHHISQVEIVADAEKAYRVMGYKNEFEQVILNIVNNAKDAFLEQHEKRGKRLEDARIRIGLSEEGEEIVITLADNAGGVNDAILKRIFEPYFTTKEQGKGTGIGLYMSRIIIEKNMHGKLSARNISWGRDEKGLELAIRFKTGVSAKHPENGAALAAE